MIMDLFPIKRDYYCLVAGLPDLRPNESKLSKTSLAFKNELKEQLHPSDYSLAELLFLQYDNKNLLNLLLNRDSTHLPLANYTTEHLEDQLKEPDNIVEYLSRFILMFNNELFDKSELNSERQLLKLYYEYVLQTKNSFLKGWFNFDRDMKNVLTAINCRKFGFDVEKQLISGSYENEVYKMLLKDSPKQDLLADELPYAERILKITEAEMSISEKEKFFDKLKWEFLDEQTFFNYFSIEKILSFIIKLNIVERWVALDNETGRSLFEQLINEIRKNYKFADEFNIKRKIPTH